MVRLKFLKELKAPEVACVWVGSFVKTVTKFGFRKREGISVLPVNAIHPSAALMTY